MHAVIAQTYDRHDHHPNILHMIGHYGVLLLEYRQSNAHLSGLHCQQKISKNLTLRMCPLCETLESTHTNECLQII